MRISIITVAYNSAATIVDTMDSVSSQTHGDIEHIVIDGCSSDSTVELVKQHGSHVAALLSEPDQGIYDAMNKGLRLATGEFVGFLNADDMLAGPDSAAAIAAAGMTADWVYGDLDYVQSADTGKLVRRWISGAYKPSRLSYGWMPPHPTFYARRSALLSQTFDVRYRISADYDFMLRCLKQSARRVVYVPEVLVKMRNGGASNRSLQALWRKSNEDLQTIKSNGVGGMLTLAAKNLRKIPQFLAR